MLAFYDIHKPTVVSADASQYGIGAVLMQEHSDGLRPVAFCSRRLSSAESRYAQIEKECLASTWACEKFNKYLCGLESFRLLSDHKPLIPLINDRDIDRSPVRCQRLLLRLMRYNAKAEHVPGKDLVVADLLSRFPTNVTETQDTEKDVIAYVHAVGENLQISDILLQDIKAATDCDTTLQQVIDFTLTGWPRFIHALDSKVRDYGTVRGELSVVDGLLIRNTRIVIPVCLRADILEKIHHGHQGLTKCRERAKQTVWWPGISEHISEIVRKCEHCQVKRAPQRHETLLSTALPDRPWQKVGADLCELKGENYLVVVDFYTRYIEIAYLGNTKAATVIGKLKNIFSRWGIPETFLSDNGPQFCCKEFDSFVKMYGINHVTSSPYFHQANGEAERAVQTAKNIIRQKDPFVALLAYRDTPTTVTGYSPNELMLSRQVRTTLPVLPEKLLPKWPAKDEVSASDGRAKAKQAFYYNRRTGARDLPELRPGDTVRMRLDHEKQWGPKSTVVGEAEQPRSYIVRGETGRTYRRNRNHLLEVPPSTPNTDTAETPDPGVASLRPDEKSGLSKINTPVKTVTDNATRSTYGRVIKPVKRLDL